MAGKWMQHAVKHPGGLHKALGIPQGKKIPKGKIAKAAHSSNPHLAKMANLAKTFAKFRPHAHGGEVEGEASAPHPGKRHRKK